MKNRRAFSLVESVLALFLFSLAAFLISQACFNCIYPLDIKEKDSEHDVLMDLAAKTILNLSDYDALDDGTELKSVDGETYRVYAEAEPTKILDLFQLRIRLSGKGKNIESVIFAYRSNNAWYERISERDTILEDRTDYLEDFRRKKDSTR